ncbi:MAG TPA: hypothetical protein DCG19_00640 [Cryomorphaceae bacterium]|nr:hypothetical protein [Owenweeksia sp.]HAD95875.1 hypothetical protein [Cryomorphaceae bacterium]HBF21315.1 hypothetical protein [Cryomorphaceae bacterium]HCQ15964.1 hypothetical protein [Cryomorphaceae bacterium]|tara:strand:+ start:253 stop:1011 length:759 start_codon:yes stop_codon:yes gene_type:complete
MGRDIKKTRVLILEDQKLHLAKALKFCKDNGYETVGHTNNAEEAFRLVFALKPDVALVDIRLKGERSGIDFATSIRKEKDLAIIFVTSLISDEVLRQASEVQPEAYLVKPYDAASLKAAVELAVYQGENSKKTGIPAMAEAEQTHPDHLFVKIGKMFKKLAYKDVNLIKTTRDKYIDIHLSSGRTVSVRKSLNQMEELLPAYFWRVHRNHIVNSRKIEGVDTGWNHVQVGDEEVSIGRSYRKDISEKFPHIS